MTQLFSLSRALGSGKSAIEIGHRDSCGRLIAKNHHRWKPPLLLQTLDDQAIILVVASDLNTEFLATLPLIAAYVCWCEKLLSINHFRQLGTTFFWDFLLHDLLRLELLTAYACTNM
jgi:hypothetical protein